MHVTKANKVVEVDIHGLTAEDAKRRLEHLLTHAAPGVEEVRIIHGYNGGQVLRDMVRLRLKHPRIQSKLISLNPGETRLLLKPLEKSEPRRPGNR
jgi:DNA-nicking Smr family endonuclease